MEIHKDLTIGEVIRGKPQTVRVLAGFGLGCMGCPSSQMETLEEASMVHGLNVDKLVQALQDA